MTDPQEDDAALREEARRHVQEMPAETALGHRDPAGGGQGEPADYANDETSRGN